MLQGPGTIWHGCLCLSIFGVAGFGNGIHLSPGRPETDDLVEVEVWLIGLGPHETVCKPVGI